MSVEPSAVEDCEERNPQDPGGVRPWRTPSFDVLGIDGRREKERERKEEGKTSPFDL